MEQSEIDALIADLRGSPDLAVRKVAAEALGSLPSIDDPVANALREAAESDSEPKVRWAARAALTKHRPPGPTDVDPLAPYLSQLPERKSLFDHRGKKLLLVVLTLLGGVLLACAPWNIARLLGLHVFPFGLFFLFTLLFPPGTFGPGYRAGAIPVGWVFYTIAGLSVVLTTDRQRARRLYYAFLIIVIINLAGCYAATACYTSRDCRY